MLACLRAHPDGTLISLYIQPRSARNQIVGMHADSLKLKLTSPPVEGAANKSCCEYLAKIFRIAKSEAVLVSGERSRQKMILLQGLAPGFVESVLETQIPKS